MWKVPPSMQRRKLLLIATLLSLSPLILAPSCQITTGPTPTGTKLGVPYRTQTAEDYCGPASVLMWRLYRGMGEVSQLSIYNSMGGGGWGRSPQQISNATSTWANTFSEVDYNSGIGDPQLVTDKFFARQVASINNRQPVIAIVESGFHAGVVNGGSNHRRTDGVYVWDSVYFHNPRQSVNRPDQQFTAGSWSNYMCGGGAACTHVIAVGSYAGYESYYDDYGSDTVMYGGTREQDTLQPLHQY